MQKKDSNSEAPIEEAPKKKIRVREKSRNIRKKKEKEPDSEEDWPSDSDFDAPLKDSLVGPNIEEHHEEMKRKMPIQSQHY